MSSLTIAAIDIGGTNIKSCIFKNGVPQGFSESPTEAHLGAKHMLTNAEMLLSQYGSVDAIGISTAGQVDPNTGIIKYGNSNIPGYTGTDVKEYFTSRFKIPTAVINDVYAAALGEGYFGAAVGISDYICITYGTGIGGGVVINGSPYYGKGPCAGVMIGGIVTHPERYISGDPFSGSYERSASTTALLHSVQNIDSSVKNGRDIFAKISDPAIFNVVDKWVDEVVSGLCTVIHSYNIPCIILGGGIMEQPYVIAEVKKRVKDRIIPGFRYPNIVNAKLGNAAGLYGAMYSVQKILNT